MFPGCAAFARRVKKDPWTGDEPDGGQLCARFGGGTDTYLSPEQTQFRTRSRGGGFATEDKATWLLTPATCDLYQASLVVLEMHSRAKPPGLNPKNAFGRVEAVRRCAERKPRESVSGLSPEETEQWLVSDLGFVKQLKGKVASNNVSSEMIVQIASLSLKEARQRWKDLTAPMHNAVKEALQTLCTPTDSMHENVRALLEKSLSANTPERPRSAEDELTQLAQITSYSMLPDASKAKATAHRDADVAATLGGLAKSFVVHGDATNALTTSAEWIGTASDAARADARAEYFKLLEHTSQDIRELGLSRSTHCNWKKDMCCGVSFAEQVATALWKEPSPTVLKIIDIAEQPSLEGAVLEKILAKPIISLQVLVLAYCPLAFGGIPPIIGKCAALRTLDLSGSAHSGASNEIWAVLMRDSSKRHLRYLRQVSFRQRLETWSISRFYISATTTSQVNSYWPLRIRTPTSAPTPAGV